MNEWIEGILQLLLLDSPPGPTGSFLVRTPPPIFASLLDAAAISADLALKIAETVAASPSLSSLPPADLQVDDEIVRDEGEERSFILQLFNAFPSWKEREGKGGGGVRVFFAERSRGGGERGVKRKTM